MSVSGRAGAGGGGPHQGALPQTAEAMWLYRFLLGKTRKGGGLDGPFLCCRKVASVLFSSRRRKYPQTNPLMGLQTESSKFSLENQRINTSSVLALSHKLVSAPMDRFI